MSDISQRMDQLPITAFHRIAICALAFAYFFELADLNTFAYAAPAIIGNWHIPVSAVALITSTSFGGMFIGGTFGGMLAHRIGRRRGFILSILVYTLFSLLNAASWDVLSLAVFRFLTGIGLSGMTVIANVYVSEFFPARLRGKYMSMIFTLGLIGIPATAWVARLVVPLAPWAWRLIFVWGSLGLLAIPFALKLLESPRWLLTKGKVVEAHRVVGKLEASAGIEAPRADLRYEGEPLQASSSLRGMFARGYRQQTIGLSLIWIFQTLGFYGFVAWVPTLLVQHGFTITKSLEYSSLMAICNPLGAWLGTFIIERFERKWIVAIDAVLIAMAGVAYGLAPSAAFIVIFGALVIITIQLMNATLYIYTPESYPTHLRSAGAGFCYGLGRLTNVVGPFIVSMLYASAGYLSVFGYISACWLVVAAVVTAIGPRTTGRPLELVNSNEPSHSPNKELNLERRSRTV
ncbi:MFS transporter [Paraburkholderia sp. SARCC-3016]|uniref:MFS transporter n=1 Tax=Paraburkholderia sp. SARCC-3016 TaxID=3058611 RepID=UPI0028070C91|nr:MFS transporter [Paraburkholderia sp. SARCC-3016]MDQ7980644.1 MFS transporter [Paraburkholderia sp. SARCC-3016]